MKIRVLPQDLMNQIAAGEVVERPASVVKELVENSIDAGATKISVEVEEGGQKKIRIVDNGSGMDRADAKLAFARHATSKIATADDLFKIKTLGFRGEALPSIASIAKVLLRSRLPRQISGTEVKVVGGEMKEPKEVGTPTGTVVEVVDLFYNTPARRKYLKSKETEYGHILTTVTDLALAHSAISFRLLNNKHQAFSLPEKQKLPERIKSLFGAELAQNIVPLHYQSPYLKITGYVGKPAVARSSREQQFLFVNDRRVENRLVAKAAFEGYHTMLQKQEYPVYFLFLALDSSLVDVNVHPQKKEIRFLNQNMIYTAVREAIRAALEKETLTPQVDLGGQALPRFRESERFSRRPALMLPPRQQSFVSDRFRASSSPVQHFMKELLADERKDEGSGARILGQVNATYLLVEMEDGLKLIDQHAADERKLYDSFRSQKSKVKSQKLLAPANIELSKKEGSALKQYLKTLGKIGFEIEEFGKAGNTETFVVNAVPADLVKVNIKQFIKEVVDDLLTAPQIKKIRDTREKIAATMACRGAVKAGDELDWEEMKHLVNLVLSGQVKTCPHGRPVMIAFSWREVEKGFGRRK